MVPGWNISSWPLTFSVGIEIIIVLRVQRWTGQLCESLSPNFALHGATGSNFEKIQVKPESESEVRTPTRQPSFGREPVRKQVWKEHGYAVQNFAKSPTSTIHCSAFAVCSHVFPIIPILDSGKLFEFACPMHCWTSNRSFSERLPLQHSASPSFMGETHDVASKFPMLINAIFSPCFLVICLDHFSHALIPNVQNFVPRIPPTNRAWSSNHASDHTSELDIKFDHIGTMDAPGPSALRFLRLRPEEACHRRVGLIFSWKQARNVCTHTVGHCKQTLRTLGNLRVLAWALGWFQGSGRVSNWLLEWYDMN